MNRIQRDNLIFRIGLLLEDLSDADLIRAMAFIKELDGEPLKFVLGK